ncbi:MAG: ornithine cyclodeaminase family protein [Desulfobacteraceae bacterium]|nr:MAG: ornithine cyclodeaminase family protein [Desulfobacteraceae bacterium]
MTLIIPRKEVETLLDIENTIVAVEQAFADHGKGLTQIPERPVLNFEDEKGVLGVMSAYIKSLTAAGVKLISHHELNYTKGLPESMGLIIYFDPTDGYPLAIMDSAFITSQRTGAASAISGKYLARKDSNTVGLIGTGALAASQIKAICQVRKISKVKAYDINPDAMSNFASKINIPDLKVEMVNNPAEACKGADIIITCTTSKEPVLYEEFIGKGTHVIGVGADMPHRRELSTGVFKLADRFVTDLPNQALITGEIREAINSGAMVEKEVHRTLAEIVLGDKPGRLKRDEITIFKSTGMAIQDVAVAKLVYDLAKERSLGLEISITP